LAISAEITACASMLRFAAQSAKRPRRRNQHNVAGVVIPDQIIQLECDLLQKIGFGLFMPVGLLDGAAAGTIGGVRPSRLSGAEFTVGLIWLSQRFPDLQFNAHDVAVILHDQSLASVAYDNPGISRHSDISHVSLLNVIS
jgi:hypothetical protein